jgi:hypothetical protein
LIQNLEMYQDSNMDLSDKAFFYMLSAFEPTPIADSTSGVAEMEPSTPLGIASHGRNERVHGLLNAVSDVLQHSLTSPQ